MKNDNHLYDHKLEAWKAELAKYNATIEKLTLENQDSENDRLIELLQAKADSMATRIKNNTVSTQATLITKVTIQKIEDCWTVFVDYTQPWNNDHKYDGFTPFSEHQYGAEYKERAQRHAEQLITSTGAFHSVVDSIKVIDFTSPSGVKIVTQINA